MHTNFCNQGIKFLAGTVNLMRTNNVILGIQRKTQQALLARYAQSLNNSLCLPCSTIGRIPLHDVGMKQSIFYHSWVKTEVLSGCHCHPDDWLSEQRSAHTHLEHGGASLHKPLGIVLRNSVLLPVSRCSFVLKRWNRKFLLRFTVQRLQRIQWDLRGVHATHPTKCQPCSV